MGSSRLCHSRPGLRNHPDRPQPALDRVKHNVVAIPLAITFDMAIRSPRRLSFWFGCCTGLAVSGFGVTQLVAGGAFVDHLLSPRVFAWNGARYHLMKYLRLSEFPFAIILLFARPIFWRDRNILAAHGIISISAATIFAGLEGTSYNIFQDAAVFLAVASGVMLHELRGCITSEAAANALAAKFTLSVAPLLLAQPILARSPEAFAQIYRAGGLLEIDRRAERSFCVIAPDSHLPSIPLTHANSSWPESSTKTSSSSPSLPGRSEWFSCRADICDDPEAVSCHILHDRRKFNRFTDEVLYAVDRY